MCKYTTEAIAREVEITCRHVLAQGKAIECKSGANLRKVLLANDIDLYNGGSLPPHSSARNLRLACQTKVLGDVTVTKYDG